MTSKYVPAVSLATKVSIAVTGVMAVLLLIFAGVSYSRTKGLLGRQVDTFGVHLARSVACVDVEAWAPSHGTLTNAAEDVVAGMGPHGLYLKEKYGLTYVPPPTNRIRSGLGQTFAAQQEEVLASFEAAQARNMSRLTTLIEEAGTAADASEVVDLFILSKADGKCLIRANDDAGSFRTRDAGRTWPPAGGPGSTLIRDGDMQKVGDVRSFTHPILGGDGTVTHEVVAFVSTGPIAALLAGLLWTQLGLAAVVTLLAGVFCFFVTRLVTAPLKDLVHDVDLVSAGDFHHRTSVHTDDEIGLLARTMDAMVRRLDRARVSHDEELQRKLSPEAIPFISGYYLDVIHKLTPEIGGTYYDFLELPNHQYGIVVAQGSKKGVAAAMNVMMAGTALRAEGHRTADPAELLQQANDTLYENTHAEMHVAALLGILNPADRTLTMCGTGELPVVFHKAASATAELFVPEGEALGVEPGLQMATAIKPRVLQLAAGDRVVLSSGGVLTLHDAHREALGLDRWLDMVRDAARAEGSHEMVPTLRHSLNEFLGSAKVDQDVVIVTLEVEGQNGGSSAD